jgi:5-methylcytosine-specific restriction endonuclease McrA
MEASVLILDIDYRPLRIASWRDAFCDNILGKLEIVEYSTDRTIKGVHREWPMPSVARVMKRFKREKLLVKFSRLNIYSRDDFKCQYCGERFPSEELTFDHVIPRAAGGRTEWTNIVTACVADNARKANRSPEQAGMRLLSKPTKPKYLPTVLVDFDRANVPKEWRNYWQGGLKK